MKTKSLLCAILCFLIHFAQAILSSLFIGTFNMNPDAADMLSYLLALCLATFLISNRQRADYFGLNIIKSGSNITYLLPLFFVPLCNLTYLFAEWQVVQSIYISVLSGIYVGIMEELIFRGFLFRAINERFNNKWAIIISSMLFGLYHLVNITVMPIEFVALQVIYATAVGVSFAIVFYISKSILPCIIVHALTDILAYIFAENMYLLFEVIGMIITILVAIFYCNVYVKHEKQENEILNISD